MALNSYGLGIIISAKDMASDAFDSVSKSVAGVEGDLDKLTDAFGSAKKTMIFGAAAIAAGLSGLAIAGSLAGSFGEFEYALARAGAIAQATAKDMGVLENAAIEAGIKTKFTSTEAADALAEMAAQGFNAKQATLALVPALDLAVGGSIGVADAATSMVSALKVFGLVAEDSGLVADKLLKISNISSLQARDLQLALGTVGKGASAAKQSLDEMLISMGLVKNTGVEASVAASAVSSALVQMSMHQDKFKKLGVALTDAEGHFRPFIDVVVDTQTALSDVTDDAERVAASEELFGRFGLTAFQAVTSQLTSGVQTVTGEVLKGADALNYLRTTMSGAAGTAATMRDRLLATWQGQADILSGVVDTTLNEIGRPFAEILRPVVTAVAGAFEAFTRVLMNMPKGLKLAAAGAFVFASVMAIVGGAALVTVAAFTLLAPLLPVIISLFFSAAAAVAPFLISLGLVASAIGMVAYAIHENIGGMGDKFDALMSKVSLSLRSVFAFLTEGKLTGPLAEEFLAADRSTQDFVVEAVVQIEKMKSAWDGFVEGIKTGIDASMPVLEGLNAEFREMGRTLGINNWLTQKGAASTDAYNNSGKMLGSTFVIVVDVFIVLFEVLMRIFRLIIELVALVYHLFMALVDLIALDFSGFTDHLGGALDALGGAVSVFLPAEYAQQDYSPGGIQRRLRAQDKRRLNDLTSDPGTGLMSMESPALAEAMLSNGDMSVNVGPESAAAIGEATAKAVSKQPLAVTVTANIDGEQLFSALGAATRDNAANQFMSHGPTE